MKYKILTIDDEQDILTLLDYNLGKAGFIVISSNDGPDAITLAKKEKPDLIILDMMLPSMEGTEVFKSLKSDESTSNIPIIMLTARGDEIDRIVGLELGAEDYITKPFSPREVVLRVKTVLKRDQAEEHLQQVISIGQITIDLERHNVTVNNRQLDLTPKEFKLLTVMARANGKTFSRNNLLDRVWGINSYVVDRTIDTHIRRLREKLGEAAKHIETVRGFGYRFLEKK